MIVHETEHTLIDKETSTKVILGPVGEVRLVLPDRNAPLTFDSAAEFERWVLMLDVLRHAVNRLQQAPVAAAQALQESDGKESAGQR